jgi:acetylornithine deacetylase
LGLNPDRYTPSDIDGIELHPAWWPGRDYTDRPNVTTQIKGKGRGRSLLLSGHIDTVPLGTTNWSCDPFGAEVKDGKLYGLGSFDMKGGVAALLSAVRVIQELDFPLAGDLIAETVVDEEFAGVNGTLAGRLRGYVADAMIVTEPSGLKIWNGNCGGRFLHLVFKSGGGIALDENVSINVVDQVNAFLNHLEEFKQLRRSQVKNWKDLIHDPVPVWITKISLGGWGTGVPVTVPPEAKVEIYWQLLPGETKEKVDKEFHTWLSQLPTRFPELFSTLPEVEIPLRYMPASEVEPDHPFIRELCALLEREQGRAPVIELGRGPSDVFVVNHFFKPCPSIMFGPGGANAHEADEYVIVDDVINLTKMLVLFAIQWCGISEE